MSYPRIYNFWGIQARGLFHVNSGMGNVCSSFIKHHINHILGKTHVGVKLPVKAMRFPMMVEKYINDLALQQTKRCMSVSFLTATTI